MKHMSHKIISCIYIWQVKNNVRWVAEGVEMIPPNEEGDIKDVSDMLELSNPGIDVSRLSVLRE